MFKWKILIESGANTFIFYADDNKKENFRDENLTWLISPKEIAEKVDIVITCLPSPESLRPWWSLKLVF